MPLLRSAFIALSRNRPLRRFSERSRIGSRLSSRFVAGLEPEDALRVAAAVNRKGIAVTLDSLGESVNTEHEAHQAAEIYHRLLDNIAARKLNANISVKLTQMGLDLSPALAESVVANLAEHAAASGNFVRIDMEGSALTQITLDIVRRLHSVPRLRSAVGVAIQAYLYRSQADVEQLLADEIRVRLCKGAYNEPPEIAFPRKSKVNQNFLLLSSMLLDSSVSHAFASHDEVIIGSIKALAVQQKISPGSFEFQMLYGVRRDLQTRLVAEGYNVRVYVPFGREWYPYFMRRLAERPANILFLARNLIHT